MSEEIAIQEKHQGEIRARLAMIAHYEARLRELEEQGQLPRYTGMVIEQAYTYAVAHGIGSDMPADLAARAVLAHELRSEYEAVERTKKSVSLIVEALQEALTFYLAEHYCFDPTKDTYELDVDSNILRRLTQEKGGQLA